MEVKLEPHLFFLSPLSLDISASHCSHKSLNWEAKGKGYKEARTRNCECQGLDWRKEAKLDNLKFTLDPLVFISICTQPCQVSRLPLGSQQ